jgi:probable F420-dependent oxidoreductase
MRDGRDGIRKYVQLTRSRDMKNDNTRQWAALTPNVPGPVLTAQAQQVEAAGLAGIFCPQTYSAPFMALGYCAAVTERVQLGSGVAIAHTRSPFETAMTAIDLDHLSDGRFVLGLGTSTRMWVEDIYGMPGYGKPIAHLRETVELIRLIIAGAHTGELDRFDGEYHRHDFSQFQGTLGPTLRPHIPIWIAAAQPGLTRLAGEIADGFMSHPIHSTRWSRERALPALEEGLRKAGRSRADIHWNAPYYVAVNADRDGALQDARATVAFYAQFEQYEPMFAAHGFEKEARACHEAARRKEYATAGAAAVTDEMTETFVILGTADECRTKVAELWDVADSFCLIPPLHSLPPDKAMFYTTAIADTFYE